MRLQEHLDCAPMIRNIHRIPWDNDDEPSDIFHTSPDDMPTWGQEADAIIERTIEKRINMHIEERLKMQRREDLAAMCLVIGPSLILLTLTGFLKITGCKSNTKKEEK